MAKTDLVIVESPSKAKTIEKYLGAGYTVKASMGHVRDLPKSKLSVDVEHGFAPDYRPIKGKESVIAELKKAARASGKVYLATDPDREGEAISWHLKELLELPEDKVCRVTFNEITKQVVLQSIAAPRAIDQNLVDAQQARRILDRIVGYQLSPLLWKHVKGGHSLSAGRVQSVAVRLVVERENEIRAFVPKEYWTLEARLGRLAPHTGSFKAQFFGKSKKIELHTEQEAEAVLAAVSGAPFTVKNVKRQDKTRQPAPPFTTSTLQQDASRKLGMTPGRTMSIAQQLYEGVDVAGVGTVGLITYMRTDSLRISAEAIAQAKSFILGRYGKEYYPEKTRYFRNRSGAQDAHEAIRPADVTLAPDEIRSSLTGEQFRLYKLIWSRFLASQMASAVYDSVSIDVEAADYIFRANGSTVKFNGFTAIYEEGRDEEEADSQFPLPDLREGELLAQEELSKTQHFTQPPARYTEATLIRALEEKGIGRPSTYAPTISTILNREYVVKEGKHLRSTPRGETVNDKVMVQEFPDIVDYAFTARMEERLDEVETGKVNWQDLLSEFYNSFSAELSKATEELEGVWIDVPDEVSEETCPMCGRQLVIKSGRFGRFLACPGYPECSFTMPLVVEMPGKCPQCGGRLVKRTGTGKTSKKQYTYYCCEFNNSKEQTHRCQFRTWDVPVKDNCPVCGQTMFKKAGRGAKKPFCINEQCANFTPEEKRGGWKKPADKTGAAKKSAPRKKTEEK